MKYFIVLALLSCVALTRGGKSSEEYEFFNDCATTKQGFDAWKEDGKRIVTFGLSWCKKSWRSQFTVVNGFKSLGSSNKGWQYHYLNCNKFAEGTCRGLFDNFLDYVDPELKFSMEYHLPRTFCIKKKGNSVKVLPISHSGRIHSNHRKESDFFKNWMDKCENM